MSFSTFPNYPARDTTSTTEGPRNGSQARSARTGRLIRDVALLAVIVAIAYESRQLAIAIERPWMLRDLQRVYETIPSRYVFDDLKTWCGLRRTPATVEEVAALRQAL